MTEQMMINLMLANQAEKYEKQLAQLRAQLAQAQEAVDEARKVMLESEAVYTRDNVRAWLSAHEVKK